MEARGDARSDATSTRSTTSRSSWSSRGRRDEARVTASSTSPPPRRPLRAGNRASQTACCRVVTCAADRRRRAGLGPGVRMRLRLSARRRCSLDGAQRSRPTAGLPRRHDLVRLDVRVLDDAGKPITDLRPDEVEVVEGGSLRPILLFQRIADSGRSYLEAAQRTIASEISTNQGAPRGQLYVLLFDQDHITPGVEQRARRGRDVPAPAPPAAGSRRHLRPARSRTGAAVHAQSERHRAACSSYAAASIACCTPSERDMTVIEAYEIPRGNDDGARVAS